MVEKTATPVSIGGPSTYVYRLPVNSHFYYKCLSPLCQWLVDTVFPDAATPDLLTLAGFACGVLATWSVNKDYFFVAGLMWQLYCIFDNCDGKQARRLKLSSHGGEFMDHATDSIITSLAGYVMAMACLNVHNEKDAIIFDHLALPFVILVGNIPYFCGIWGQAAYGQVIMGVERIFDTFFNRSVDYGEDRSPEWISVDEYNFFLVPGLCFARAFIPELFTSTLVSWTTDPLMVKMGLASPSLGLLALYTMIVISIFTCTCVMFFLLQGRKGQFFVVPLALWASIAVSFKLPFVVTGTVFSLISFEVLVKQLKIHKHTSAYILYPLLLELVFVFDPSSFLGTPPSSDLVSDARAQMIMILSTAGIMFTYKNVIHARNNEPNIPWVITKKKELEEIIRSQINDWWGENDVLEGKEKTN